MGAWDETHKGHKWKNFDQCSWHAHTLYPLLQGQCSSIHVTVHSSGNKPSVYKELVKPNGERVAVPP